MRLETALAADDLDAAASAADSVYQLATNTPALTTSSPDVIIDPAMVAETVEFSRKKAAFEIAQSYYNHAQLDAARQWARVCASGGTLAEPYVRKATVLLGRIATAMDNDDEAVAQSQRMIEYFTANAGDLTDDSIADEYQLQCRCYRAMALAALGQRQPATDEIRDLLDRAQGHAELEAKFAEILALYSDRATAAGLYEWVANKYPSHPWANIGRLEQAIRNLTPATTPARRS